MEDGETLETELPMLAEGSDDEEYTDQVSLILHIGKFIRSNGEARLAKRTLVFIKFDGCWTIDKSKIICRTIFENNRFKPTNQNSMEVAQFNDPINNIK